MPAGLSHDMGSIAESDAELLAASRRGETTAFGRLVERYQAVVLAVSFSATGDRALSEDVAQDTFLAAWTRLGSLREPSKLRSWLCAIARNLGLKARRRIGREIATGDALELSSTATPLDATLEAESSRIVWDSLRRVPAAYREVLVLYYQEGHSVAAVARSLGLAEDAVMQRLSRGRRALQDGVAGLVEQSLAGRRPRPGFAAAIVAALPAHPMSSTHARGETSMLKIAAIGSFMALVGGATTYAVIQPEPDRPTAVAATAASPGVASTIAPTPAPPPTPRPPQLSAASDNPAPGRSTHVGEETSELEPRIDGEQLVKLQKGRSRGPADAPVQIVLFTDFLCHYCEKVVATVDQLFDDYPDKLRLVIKQFPVHKEARLAAEAALAAEAQGKFWELHDLLMTNQDDLSKPALLGFGQQAGLDMAAFTKALDERTYQAAVAAEQQEGKDIDVRGTPTFLINGRPFRGAQPIDVFQQAIDAELASAGLPER